MFKRNRAKAGIPSGGQFLPWRRRANINPCVGVSEHMPPPPHSQWDLKDLAPDVAEFFDRAKTITPREARLLNEMRYATYSEVAHNAQITARAAIGEEAVWQMSLLIDEQRNEARAEHHANAHDNVRDDEWNRAQIDAMTPVWDACLALTARDTISEEQFNVLYRPWKTVMEKEN